MVDPIEGDRLNPGIFDAVIPTAVHVQRSETHTEQVEDVVYKGKAFSASGQWNFCKSWIGYAGVTIQAQKKQRKLHAAMRANTANKKIKAHLKTLERHKSAK